MAARKGSFPKAAPEAFALLESLVPAGRNIELRPMFGHRAAFVNGNMFAGTFGSSLVLRLHPDEQTKILKQKGAAPFEPMPGRPMKGYVRVDPAAMKKELDSWVARALAFTRELPAKTSQRAARKAKAPAKKAKRAL